MHRRRPRPDPLTRLVLAFRVAAQGINVPAVRRIAANEADRIPETRLEKAHGGKGKVAEHGRAIMRHLPTMEADDLAQAAADLLSAAEALKSSFHVTSEIRLGERRRSA